MVNPHQKPMLLCLTVEPTKISGLLYSIHNIYIYIYIWVEIWNMDHIILYIIYSIIYIYIYTYTYNIYIYNMSSMYIIFTTQKWWVSVNWISIGHVAILQEIHGQITINYRETVCCVVSPNSWVVCQPIMRGCESVNRWYSSCHGSLVY